jgi:hypothetical protein
MTPTRQHEIYFSLCDALGKRPGESLHEAARRACHVTTGDVQRAAVAILLRRVAGDPWAALRLAHSRLRGGIA